MGLRLCGLATNNNFDKDIDKLSNAIGRKLSFVEDIQLETSTYDFDDGYLDVYFHDNWTLIIDQAEDFDLAKISDKSKAIRFMANETVMLFYLDVYENRKQIREYVLHEGEIKADNGIPLPEENPEEDESENILNAVGSIIGFTIFYDDSMGEFKGKRYKIESVVKEEPYKAPFYDSSTKASNPGNFDVSYLQWAKMNLGRLRRYFITFIILYFIAQFHWSLWIFMILFMLYLVINYFGIKNTFKAGDVNPGMILSTKPTIVAVCTDMSKGLSHQFPILYIFETTVPRKDNVKGNIIPTAALYSDNRYDLPFWGGFEPIPFSHATANATIIQEKMDSFSDDDISKLKNNVESSKSLSLGYHNLDIASSSWKDFPSIDLNDLKDPKKKN